MSGLSDERMAELKTAEWEYRYRLVEANGRSIEAHEDRARAEYLLTRFPKAHHIVTERRRPASAWVEVAAALDGGR